ncbi:MAG: flagellar protein FlgN [endosymbiont of Seepiophila jonesi]|uniref:Flagellar protein FlgN n=1 Tax=endosymbiont of Lamellibrachia luymesi TaxID=2200907 RepID=A0A370DK02_9GAMM|nr:MAG: flagellar protein FlgN [endosymbiont of Lamellibrachia luymesi]RDH93069.1 MAG: flagellar protein FlgN [endosymbiont of Seepiophila jonesi]
MKVNNPTSLQGEFTALLQSEIDESRRLLDILLREHKLLQGASSAPLEQLTAEKQQQMAVLETAVVKHNRLLLHLDLQPNREGSEQLLQQLPEAGSARQLWEEFEQLIETCQKQNDVNGDILSLNQRQVSQAIDILRGVTTGQKTYGPSGESRPDNHSNSFGKA